MENSSKDVLYNLRFFFLFLRFFLDPEILQEGLVEW